MPVRNVQEVLTEAVGARLDELVVDEPDVSVLFHIAPFQQVDFCEEGQHVVVDMFWRLNLFLRYTDNRLVNLAGVVPYEVCMDGDPAPLVSFTEKMWQDQKFGHLLADSNLDAHLDQVAADYQAE